jgi:hypothetical protein
MDLEDHSSVYRYPAVPDEGIVALLVGSYFLYGMIPMIQSIPFPSLENPLEKIKAHQRTDLKYIRQIAANNGFIFQVSPGPVPGTNIAYFGPEFTQLGWPQPALNINMDAHTNVESLSFSLDGLSPKSLALRFQEPISKFGITIPLPVFNPLMPPLAAKQATTLRVEPINDGAKLDLPKLLGKGMSEATAAAMSAVTGRGSLDVLRYGHVLKRGVVGVRGAGASYDGLYYVKSVTHDIKRGEYKQSFTLARNGTISITPRVPT